LTVTLLLGIAGLSSSAMIYVATKRRLWRAHRTWLRFLGTAVTAGGAWAAVALASGHAPAAITSLLLLTTLILSLAKLDWEYRILLGPDRDAHDRRRDDDHDRRSRRLVNHRLTTAKRMRLIAFKIAIGLLVGSLIAVVALPPVAALPIIALAALASTAGELGERWLYFSSVVYDRMPGTMQ
jgi:DMSO reductase anchor subunit